MDIREIELWIRTMCLISLVWLRSSDSTDEVEYLMKYGYMEQRDFQSGYLISGDYVREAVKKFQKMAGLPITGIIDDETKKTMQLPRCGVKDTVGTAGRARRRRYALHGSKWPKRDITYRVSRYSSKLAPRDVDREIQRAFHLWSNNTPLTFRRQSVGRVDIEIKFVSGRHGDNTPFDGSGQTLAHAYFPQYGGDAHFDDAETWTFNTQDGVNLYQVAAHEFGHSLGLAHSDVRAALMAPFYRGYQPGFQLHPDDIDAVQEIYGTELDEHTTRRPFELEPTKRPFVNIPSICRDASIDAITQTDSGITYMFKGKYYYRLDDHGLYPGYPRLIAWDWGNIDGPIDAALTWPNGWTFVFKGISYWKFHNQDMIYGPKNISEGFDGIPSHIDTAFVWSGNGKTYFLKDDKYWRYYGNRIDTGYPRDLSVWRGLPPKINAAFQWQKNGRTYFYAGDQYYRYDDQAFDIDADGYPRDVAVWWLGCLDKGQIIQYDLERQQQNMQTVVAVDSDVSGDVSGRDNDEQWITLHDSDILKENDVIHSGSVSIYRRSLPAVVLYVFLVEACTSVLFARVR